ncbi:FAD-dependent oxidoreductase [Sphingomonas crocodyli]|uniref:FAD-dependent oxidoreductase n=1 Tax=Sphingomonas crocodyli TaxID=1979270 RepID=A0A437LYU4_9SPHN|nr:FAD-dependent oxidoreductase [Sphingomonas crocodyli]
MEHGRAALFHCRRGREQHADPAPEAQRRSPSSRRPVTDGGTALIIGGGIYGASIATYLKTQRGFSSVILFEREDRLLQRSSYVNQARVHNGYHYPRSFTTAYRSRINLPRFVTDFGAAIVKDFVKLYAIARLNSKVTSRQFERFCHEIGAFLEPAEPAHAALFNPRLIASVYVTQEYGFNTAVVARQLEEGLTQAAVDVRLSAHVSEVTNGPDGVRVRGYRGPDREPFEASGAFLFNCTYSGLQHGAGLGTGNAFGLKHEITEMALIEPPAALKGIAVTVMDGPFFSIMPFPDRGLHTLSHVRYTPHMSWREDGTELPYDVLDRYRRESRSDRMVRDAARYMPALAGRQAKDSLFEVKTVPIYTEGNDGRPILLSRDPNHGRIFSILGGKVDNIYDILERLDDEPLQAAENVHP